MWKAKKLKILGRRAVSLSADHAPMSGSSYSKRKQMKKQSREGDMWPSHHCPRPTEIPSKTDSCKTGIDCPVCQV